MENKHLPFARARTLPNPTKYVTMLLHDYAEWAFDEERAPLIKGKWRQIFSVPESAPLDLEIGTGNGTFFLHRAGECQDRSLVGIEIKFKPLIQTIRRAINAKFKNARIIRYDASLLTDIFSPGELDDIFIFFPDPWPRKRDWKHRLIQAEFLEMVYTLQKPGSSIYFKTDSRDYFDWSLEKAKTGPYELSEVTFDLHNSEWASSNFKTQFENIFLRQGLPIHRFRLKKR